MGKQPKHQRGAYDAEVTPGVKHWWRHLAIATVVLVVALAGLLATFAFVPSTASTAIVGVAKLNALHERLPKLNIPPLPQNSTLLAADGTPIATFYLDNRIPVKLNQVSPNVVNALVSTEDRTFFTNNGISPKGIARATVADLSGRATQGGSTITQQYVKNILAYREGAAAHASTINRKLNEVIYATQLTKHMSKDAILQGYLNLVYFGAGAYGIDAASERYFSIPPAQLSLTQAALLVATVRSPIAYNPLVNPKDATAARNRVLGMMAANHKLTLAQAAVAKTQPLDLKPSYLQNGCAATTDPYPYFCSWVVSTLTTLPELGATPAARLAKVEDGGLTIKTTLQPSVQSTAQAAVISKVGYGDPVGASIVVVTPGTGAVTAMANNRYYGTNGFFNQTEVNYATSASPVGSTFKAFTLATALGQDVPLSTILPAGAAYHSPTLDNPPSGYYTNAEPSDGSDLTIAQATDNSVNTAYVQLEEKVGVQNVAATAHKMGLTSLPLSGPNAPSPAEGSLTLGARGFSPLEMASSYATLAASGTYCAPLGVSSITDAVGKVLPVSSSCSQVIAPAVAATETSLLAGVVTSGTGTAAAVPGHAIAGKTGTTTNFGSAWFIGYTPTTATAVWMGDPRGPSYPLTNVAGVGQVYGGTLPAEMFSQAMTGILAGQNTPAIPPPSDAYMSLSAPTLPDLTFIPASLARARLLALGLVPAGLTTGVVHSTVPAAGTAMYAGQVVRLDP